MQENITLESSFRKTLNSDSFQDIVIENADLALDSILDNPVTKELPVVKYLFALGKGVSHFKDYMLVKKVFSFFLNIKTLSKDQRQAALDAIISGKNGYQNAGEAILTIIDKADTNTKPEMIGKLFTSLGNNTIDVAQFFRLSHIVINTYIEDLNKLKDFYIPGSISTEVASTFAANGLMTMLIINPIDFESKHSIKSLAESIYETKFETKYSFTTDAKLLAEIVFDVPSEDPRVSSLNNFF
jgi:hypothetical protein